MVLTLISCAGHNLHPEEYIPARWAKHLPSNFDNFILVQNIFLQNVLVGYFWHCCCCWAYSWICESDQKSWMNSSEKLPFKPNTNIFNQSESIWFLFLFYVSTFSFFKRVFYFSGSPREGREDGLTLNVYSHNCCSTKVGNMRVS